jgi:hypothetical protein
MIEAGLSSEVVDPLSPVTASEVGVRRVPVPAGGDRGRGALVSAVHPTEVDHSQLKHRLRPMRGPRTEKTAQVVIAGHAFMRNLRRGHYELSLDAAPATRVSAAFADLALAI